VARFEDSSSQSNFFGETVSSDVQTRFGWQGPHGNWPKVPDRDQPHVGLSIAGTTLCGQRAGSFFAGVPGLFLDAVHAPTQDDPTTSSAIVEREGKKEHTAPAWVNPRGGLTFSCIRNHPYSNWKSTKKHPCYAGGDSPRAERMLRPLNIACMKMGRRREPLFS